MDPTTLEKEHAMNAFENGISYLEIRYFFNSYPPIRTSNQDKENPKYVIRRAEECASWLDDIRDLFKKEELVDTTIFEKKRGWMTEAGMQTYARRLLRKGLIRQISHGRYSIGDSSSNASMIEHYMRITKASTTDMLSPHNWPAEVLFIYDAPLEQLKRDAEWIQKFEDDVAEVTAAFNKRVLKLYAKHAGHAPGWERIPAIFVIPRLGSPPEPTKRLRCK